MPSGAVPDEDEDLETEAATPTCMPDGRYWYLGDGTDNDPQRVLLGLDKLHLQSPPYLSQLHTPFEFPNGELGDVAGTAFSSVVYAVFLISVLSCLPPDPTR